MAHSKKLEKGPHEAETSLSCAHCMVLVVIYKNDPPPTLQNILQTHKAVQLILVRIVGPGILFHPSKTDISFSIKSSQLFESYQELLQDVCCVLPDCTKNKDVMMVISKAIIP